MDINDLIHLTHMLFIVDEHWTDPTCEMSLHGFKFIVNLEMVKSLILRLEMQVGLSMYFVVLRASSTLS